MARDYDWSPDLIQGIGEEVVNEVESGNVAPFSGGAPVAREIGEEALVSRFHKAFQEGWIAINEVALSVEKDEAAAGGSFRVEDETVE